MTIPFHRRTALALIATLGLAGCAAEQPGPADGAPSTGDPQAHTTSARPAAEPLPLDPYRAVVDGRAAFDLEKQITQDNRLQELLAECMAEEGFEFFPDVHSVDEVREYLDAPDPDFPEKGTLEFAERYGFGFYHDPVQEHAEAMIDPGLDPRTQAELDYQTSLSQSELGAYNKAFNGDQEEMWSTDENGESVFVYDWTKAGCMGSAEHAVYGDETDVNGDPAFAELLEAIQAAAPTRENDDDAAELAQEWSACMSEAGYPFPDRETAERELYQEFEATMYAPKTNDGSKPKWKSTPEQFEAFFTERERPLAMADATCAEQVDYAARFREIVVAFEQRFVDEHRDQLDALVLQYGG